MKDVNNFTGLDKAAILFQVFGESLALTMFQELPETELLKIRVRARELKNVSVDVKQNILEEYYFGREFSVDGIVIGKTPYVLSVSEKYNLGPTYNFIMCGFSMGKISNEDEKLLTKEKEIREMAKQAAVAMGISNSFFSVDLLLTQNDLAFKSRKQ